MWGDALVFTGIGENPTCQGGSCEATPFEPIAHSFDFLKSKTARGIIASGMQKDRLIFVVIPLNNVFFKRGIFPQ